MLDVRLLDSHATHHTHNTSHTTTIFLEDYSALAELPLTDLCGAAAKDSDSETKVKYSDSRCFFVKILYFCADIIVKLYKSVSVSCEATPVFESFLKLFVI